MPTGGTQCGANDFTFTISAADYNAYAADGVVSFTTGSNTAVNTGLGCPDTYTLALEVSLPGGAVPYINDYTGTQNASGVYPVGTTTVTYFTEDAFGNPVTCSFDVTVTDQVAPVFMNCLKDQTISLDAGECEYVFNYEPVAMDNCPFGEDLTWQVPATFLPHGGGSITVAGSQVPGGFFFDLENLSMDAITINSLDVRFAEIATPPAAGTNTTVSVYLTTTATTAVGNEANSAAWTQITGAPIPVVIAPIGETTNVPLSTSYRSGSW